MHWQVYKSGNPSVSLPYIKQLNFFKTTHFSINVFTNSSVEMALI